MLNIDTCCLGPAVNRSVVFPQRDIGDLFVYSCSILPVPLPLQASCVLWFSHALKQLYTVGVGHPILAHCLHTHSLIRSVHFTPHLSFCARDGIIYRFSVPKDEFRDYFSCYFLSNCSRFVASACKLYLGGPWIVSVLRYHTKFLLKEMSTHACTMWTKLHCLVPPSLLRWEGDKWSTWIPQCRECDVLSLPSVCAMYLCTHTPLLPESSSSQYIPLLCAGVLSVARWKYLI